MNRHPSTDRLVKRSCTNPSDHPGAGTNDVSSSVGSSYSSSSSSSSSVSSSSLNADHSNGITATKSPNPQSFREKVNASVGIREDTSSDEESSGCSPDSHEFSDHNQESGESSHDEARLHLPIKERIDQDHQGTEKGFPPVRDRRERKRKALEIIGRKLSRLKQDDSNHTTANKSSKPSLSQPAQKKSKHAPTEASSKRSEFFKRKVTLNESGIGIDIGAHRYKPRDPRMSNLNGHLDVEQFERNYKFVEQIRDQEIRQLRARIEAWKCPGKKGQRKRRAMGMSLGGSSLDEDKERLKILLQQKAVAEREQVERAAKKAVKKKLQQEVADGKRGVYFPKRSELKRMQLDAKFEELRKRGGDKAVQEAVAKRRKKNKSRDAKLFGDKEQTDEIP